MNQQWLMPLSQVKMKIQVEKIAGTSNFTERASAEGKAATFSSEKRTALKLRRFTHKGTPI